MKVLRFPAVLIAVAILGLAVVGAENRDMVVTNPLEAEGVTVLDARSRSFHAAIERLVDSDIAAKAASVLPYSVVIGNQTGKFIWGFTATYTFPDSIAPSGRPWRHMFSFGGRGVDHNRMLAPGASYLVTPISEFSAATDAGGVRTRPVLITPDVEQRIATWNKRSQNERVQVTVDSVIYEDGTIVGPDEANMMEKLNSRIRAQQEVVELMQSGKGVAQIRQDLLLISASHSRGEYGKYKARLAETILQSMDHNESAVIELWKLPNARLAGFDAIRREQRD